MSSLDASQGPAGPGCDGFASEEQRAAANALLDQCAQFKGAGEALAGRRARAVSGPVFEFEPGWVGFPQSALRDLAAGPMGRLGMSLMGAAAELLRAQKLPAKPAAPALASSAPRSGNSAWLDEAQSERHEARPAAAPVRPRRVFAEEGEGEESFAYLVGKLESEGFGGTSFEQIAANKAKSAASKKRF